MQLQSWSERFLTGLQKFQQTQISLASVLRGEHLQVSGRYIWGGTCQKELFSHYDQNNSVFDSCHLGQLCLLYRLISNIVTEARQGHSN